MNEAACTILTNFVSLAVRMMPIFVCLPARERNKETIAAVSVYLWALMVSLTTVFAIPDRWMNVYHVIFAGLFFLVLLIFFEGSVIKKAFLYVSAWLFALLSESLCVLVGWFLTYPSLTYDRARLGILVVYAVLYYFFVRYFLEDKIDRLFESLSLKNSSLLLAVPGFFLFLLYSTSLSIFSTETLMQRGLRDILIYFLLCVMIVAVYIILLKNVADLLVMNETRSELGYARQLIEQQKAHYDQMLKYTEQIRILKHDYRHHLHAIAHMSKEEEAAYLKQINKELDAGAELVFCRNAAVDSLLQEYASRARQANIRFTADLAVPEHMPVDDLTLCIIIGNLLENATEACLKLDSDRFITLNARREEGALLLMVENAYNGEINKSGSRLLSTKSNGGLGHLSIRRLLTMKGDEFDVHYTDETFVAMVRIADRAG